MYFVPLLEQKYYKMTIQNISKYQIVFIFQIILFCLPLSLTAQDEMNVNFNKIGDKHVSRAIKERGLVTLPLIHELQPTPNCRNDKSYYDHIKTYSVDQSLQNTWDIYSKLNIKKAWTGKKIVRYGFVYDTNNCKILYSEQENQTIEIGQKVFFNVHLLGFINLVTVLEVIDIDEEEHSITFSYMQGGNTMGTQKIILEATGKTTLIKHVTNYRSVKPSKLRDKRLYPFFHTKSINEVHKNALGGKLKD